jgi:hypothetical protein
MSETVTRDALIAEIHISWIDFMDVRSRAVAPVLAAKMKEAGFLFYHPDRILYVDAKAVQDDLQHAICWWDDAAGRSIQQWRTAV